VGGESHLWRQRFPSGEPEQLTFGPTEEEGVALAPDGRSLVTSVGQRRALLWLRDSSGERQLSHEGSASAPRLSADGRRVYYLSRQTAASPEMVLRVIDLDSSSNDRLLPGFALLDFDVSSDEREIAFTMQAAAGDRRIWLAPVDLREAAREIARGADQVQFGAGEQLVFRSLGTPNNLLFRIDKDGARREQVSDLAIVNLFDVSPDGAWATVWAAGSGDSGSTEGYAISMDGGAPRRLCVAANCQARWSPAGEAFYLRFPADDLGARQAGQVTVVFRTTAGQMLPALPTSGLTAENAAATVTALGAQVLTQEQVAAGPDPSTNVFVRTATQSNLFRVPFD
jgi:Tol biopolymer transport system component